MHLKRFLILATFAISLGFNIKVYANPTTITNLEKEKISIENQLKNYNSRKEILEKILKENEIIYKQKQKLLNKIDVNIKIAKEELSAEKNDLVAIGNKKYKLNTLNSYKKNIKEKLDNIDLNIKKNKDELVKIKQEIDILNNKKLQIENSILEEKEKEKERQEQLRRQASLRGRKTKVKLYKVSSRRGGYYNPATIASKYLGVPYVWGGETPNGFDCSGLVYYIYKQLGITLPRTASLQQKVGIEVSRNEANPGDLLFFGKVAHHVAIYAGNGYMIHAPQRGDVVKYQKVDWRKVSNIKRIIN